MKSKYEDLPKGFWRNTLTTKRTNFPEVPTANRSFNKERIQLDSRPSLRKLCKNLHGSGVYTSPYEIGTVPVKKLADFFFRSQTCTLWPRLHGSGQIFARTKTCTVPPCVHTGPAELDEFFNGKVCKFGT